MKALTIEDFINYMDQGFEVVDFRDPDEFANGFVPRSFYINPQDENALVIYNQFAKPFNKLIAIFPDQSPDDINSILQNIDALNVVGYLIGGFQTWKNTKDEFDMLITIDPDEFEMDIKHDQEIELMDIRSESEFEQIHLEGSVNAPLNQIPLLTSELRQDEKLYILSNSKSTSLSVAAYLNRHGITFTRTLNGSFTEMRHTSLPLIAKNKKKKTKNNKGNGKES